MYHKLSDRRTEAPVCIHCGKPLSKWRASDECPGKPVEKKEKKP